MIGDPVGYTFQAENLCPSCTRTAAAFALAGPGEAAFMGRPSDADDCEAFLDRWAAATGVTRDDEHSFDTDDFPKPVFSWQTEPGELCGSCGWPL